MTVVLIYLPKPSARSTNRKGERGSSFLMPLDGEKGLDGTPFTRMEKKAKEVSFMT